MVTMLREIKSYRLSNSEIRQFENSKIGLIPRNHLSPFLIYFQGNGARKDARCL